MARASVVLDTNVVVSAHLNAEGYERFVLDLALASRLQMWVSPEILEEYREVLAREKFAINPAKIATSLRLIEEAAEHVSPRRRTRAARDPGDNKFLECASEVKADYLVTGNKKHFPSRWGRTRVVNARELIEDIVPELRR